MAQASSGDIRVIFRPEGVKGVIDGLRLIRREAEALQKSGAGTPAFGGGGFVNLFDKATPAATGFGAALNSIFATAQRLLPVLGFVGATSAIVAIGRSSLETASDVSKLRQQFSLTAEDLTSLQFTARTNEATNDDLARGLQGLAKSQRELRAGTEDVVTAYADLGLTARDFQGLNLAQSLELIGKSMKGIDPTRLNLDTILGRNSRELIPTLNELADKGLAGVRKEAEKVGAVLSGETVSATKKAADEMQLLKESVDGAGNSFVATFGPVIRRVTGSLSATLDTVRALVSGDALGALKAQFQGFKNLIGFGKDEAKPKPLVPGGPGADVQRQIIETSKRAAEEQFKALSEQNRQRREIAEASIEGERRVVEARVAGSRDQIQAARELQEADASALQKRIALAKDFSQRQTDIAKARHEAELQLSRQSGTDAGFAVRRVEIDRRAAQERLGIATSLFQELKRLEADALNQFKASKTQQKVIDDEVAANRRKLEQFKTDIASSGDSPVSRSIDQENAAIKKQGELVKAVTAGNIDEARRLKGELEGIASALAGGGTVLGGSTGLKVLEDATKAFEPLLLKQKELAVQQEAASVKALASIKEQTSVAEKALAELAAKPVQIRLGLAESELQGIVQQIQAGLNAQTFTFKAQPVGGGVPGMADGGRLGGSSPGPRSDNLLFAGTAGEYIQPVAAVRKYGLGFMEAVRTRTLPRFADGGSLGGGDGASVGGTVEHFINIGGRRVGPIWAEQDRVTELVGELQRQLAG